MFALIPSSNYLDLLESKMDLRVKCIRNSKEQICGPGKKIMFFFLPWMSAAVKAICALYIHLFFRYWKRTLKVLYMVGKWIQMLYIGSRYASFSCLNRTVFGEQKRLYFYRTNAYLIVKSRKIQCDLKARETNTPLKSLSTNSSELIRSANCIGVYLI